ncbi:MAG: ribonuclease P protein component [Candidatus Ratteibacteria bacterium]|jgi:ribonuclease P protein component
MKKNIYQLQKSGRKIKTSHFLLYYHDSERMKIGFLLSKGNGKASIRNKIKRIVREWCSLHLGRGDLLFRLLGDCTLCHRTHIEKELFFAKEKLQ